MVQWLSPQESSSGQFELWLIIDDETAPTAGSRVRLSCAPTKQGVLAAARDALLVASLCVGDVEEKWEHDEKRPG